MSELLAESPLVVSIALGVLSAALIYGWLQTGKKPLAIIGLVLAVCVPLAWVIAENWVTDRERIEQLIHEVADAVEANDHPRALSVIGDESTRRQAAGELPQWEFSQADVGNIRSIRVIENTLPVQAEVEMTVKVTVSSKRGSIQNISVPRRLNLTFEKRGLDSSDHGGWVVTGYRHFQIVGNADGFTSGPIQ
ncbi:hypothetical protein [Neorhodopirellula pilleata]|uniref:Uncharacterized protein n=1 Tax=Neorhodopirellula pilleata TaxID=2714738 RepID=A0A5C6AUH5_9BACT|nr:hypothetical protein [Neorhodopirellula pilleata]TWU03127.1 hypothetical protein Pla100_00450 [Neorhodopirellula pilleata]